MTKKQPERREQQSKRERKARISYPSAPAEPAARREHFQRRNALIAGVPEDEYLAGIQAQEAHAREHTDEQRPSRS
jgi:hypothetical protein